MMDRTLPLTPDKELLQRLPQFVREVGQIISLPLLAERILSGLCQATYLPNGSLYLGDHNHQHFRCAAVHGQGFGKSIPPTIPSDHPLIRQLARQQHILGTSAHISDLDLLTGDTLSSEIESRCSSMAIPLVSKGRMVACILLCSDLDIVHSNLEDMEILSAMAQAAATALDSTLLQKEGPYLETLMCRTDRLRTLELIVDGYAHAIRNPLTSIKAFIQLAGEQKDDAEFFRDFSRMALEDVYRLQHVTQELLDYARYAKPQLTNEDLNEIVSSCLSLLELRTECRLIKIEKDLAPELPRGMLDRQHMQHALLNLLFHALKAHDHGRGALCVRTSTSAKPNGEICTHVEIERTGQTTSDRNPEQIGCPDVTTLVVNEDKAGTGVGLAIAQHIIRAHRGDIHIQRTEGVGTIYRINLPSHAA